MIATGFSGGQDNQASFFSSEAATRVAATNVQRNNAAPTVEAPREQQGIPMQPQVQPSMTQSQNGGNISGTLSVDEDPSIPPFLRKMRG